MGTENNGATGLRKAIPAKSRPSGRPLSHDGRHVVLRRIDPETGRIVGEPIVIGGAE